MDELKHENQMALSEAIRIGATLHPQGFGIGVWRDADNNIQSTCALGAALVAAGGLEPFNDLLRSHARHPITNRPMPVGGIIANLNDGYTWSRNAIADWVEKVEHQGDKDEQRARQEEYEYQDRVARERGGAVSGE